MTLRNLRATSTIQFVSAVAVALAACGRPVNEDRHSASFEAAEAARRSAVTTEALIYSAALDRLVADRGSLWSSGGQDSIRVLDTIYWWPIASSSAERGAGLGPVPFVLPDLAHRLGRNVKLVRTSDGSTLRETSDPGGPLLVFGPIDFESEDQAVLKVAIYMGPLGQELYRIHLKATGQDWHANDIQVEFQT